MHLLSPLCKPQTKIVNCTPHDVHLYQVIKDDNHDPHGTNTVVLPVLTIPKSGIVARIEDSVIDTGCICDDVEPQSLTYDDPSCARRFFNDGSYVPYKVKSYGNIVDLPEPQKDTLYLVSLVTALASDRQDLLVVSDEVRDEAGRIIGCLSLAFIKR